MNPSRPSSGVDRRTLLGAFAAVPVLSATHLASRARAANASAQGGFSFAAVGDTRPMMYLPPSAGEPDLVKFFVEMFGLVMPDRVAEEVVKKYVRMTFDPGTKELIQVVMPFAAKTEVMTLTVDKGWVTEASVEDIKLLPGVHRTMFRLEGRRVGGARDRQGRQSGPRQICGQQWRRRLVGKSRPHRRRQPLLEARQRHHAEAFAAARRRDAFSRTRRPMVHRNRQSRSLGRPQDRGHAQRRALHPEARRYARKPHLQVRLPRLALHLSLERQIRLPLALELGMPTGRNTRSRSRI
jgi:hypothetical protein